MIHAETRRRGGDEVIHYSPDSFLQGRPCEVDEQAYRLPGQSQIRVQLLKVSFADSFHAFDFDNQAMVYEQIEPERRCKPLAFEFDVYRS